MTKQDIIEWEAMASRSPDERSAWLDDFLNRHRLQSDREIRRLKMATMFVFAVAAVIGVLGLMGYIRATPAPAPETATASITITPPHAMPGRTVTTPRMIAITTRDGKLMKVEELPGRVAVKTAAAR